MTPFVVRVIRTEKLDILLTFVLQETFTGEP